MIQNFGIYIEFPKKYKKWTKNNTRELGKNTQEIEIKTT
jgi:hypothetical protein